MRAIITGGTGLIGRALASDLALDGHEVAVLSRNPDKASRIPAGVRVQLWDALTAEGWGYAADGADVIVNLAGESIAAGRWTSERKRCICESRLNAGHAIIQAIEGMRQKPRVVIQSSGVGFYGPRGDEEVTEETPSGNDFLARFAIEWEACTAGVKDMGVRLVIIRSGVVLSTEGGALPRILLPFRMFVGGRLGSGGQWFPWIHISDEVRAIRFLIENETASGPFNLTAPNPVTNAELGRYLGRAIGRPSVMRAPAVVLRLLLGEMATALLDGQRALPRRLLEMEFQFRFPGIEIALRDLLR